MASWPLGDEGPLWIHSVEHAHRASCERGGSLVRQAPPGDRSCLEPPRTPFPLNSPSAAPQPATPFLSFLYISSELAVAVQSLVNDALLLLTTLQLSGLHSLYHCLDFGDTHPPAPALGLFTCFCPRASTINTRTRHRTYFTNKQTLSNLFTMLSKIAAVALAATLVSAQTHTLCDPTKKGTLRRPP